MIEKSIPGEVGSREIRFYFFSAYRDFLTSETLYTLKPSFERWLNAQNGASGPSKYTSGGPTVFASLL